MRDIITALCAGASLMALSGPAFAQDKPVLSGAEPATTTPEGAALADETGKLAPSNEIVVSARRRAESVQDVPQTVNVVTSAQVEKLNLRNFTEIASVVPGLQLNTNSAFSNSATVRGVAFTPEVSGNNPAVEFYLNDAPISSAFLFQTTYDFGQFELQRGPQGTLRGRASPSGSIAVTTRRPDLDQVGAVFNGTITDLHARKLDGAFNIPIISNVLAVRVAGAIDNNRGSRVRAREQGDPLITDEGPFRRTESLRGSVRFEPVDWAQFNVMYQTLHNDTHRFDQVVSNSLLVSGAPQTTALIRPFDRLGIDELGSYDRQDQDVVVGNADFQFTGQQLSYVGSYSKQRFGVIASQDTTDFLGSPGGTALAPRVVVDPDARFFDQTCSREIQHFGISPTSGTQFQCTNTIAKRESHELRLASEERLFGSLDYVVGVFYDKTRTLNLLNQESANLRAIAGGGLTSAFSPQAIQTFNNSTEKSAFANLTAHLLDERLELAGGLRYIDYKIAQGILLRAAGTGFAVCAADPIAGTSCLRQTIVINGNPVSVAPDGTVGPGRDNLNKTIYSASIKFKITPDVMVYALTGSSWRPPASRAGNFNVIETARERSFTFLPPETSKSYELGAKMTFFDRRARLNISAFRQNFKNYPFAGDTIFYRRVDSPLAPAGGLQSFQFAAAVPVKVKGVEGEASFDITNRWSIGLNASYADGKIKNGTIPCTDVNNDNIPDAQGVDRTPSSVADLTLPAGENIDQCTGVDRRSSNAPKFSANIQSEIGFDLGGSTDAFVRGLYTFAGKTSNNPENRFDDAGAFGLLNLFAGVRDPNGAWEISVFGKNILREREVLTVGGVPLQTSFRNLAGGNVAFQSQYRSISVTAPREVGLSARIAFGSR